MAKKKGKKVKDQGSSIDRPKKKILKSMKKKKKTLKIKADPMPSAGPISLSKLVPDVTPTIFVTPSVVPPDNGGTPRRIKEKEYKERTGFIFMCNGKTKPECYKYRVFGLPRGQLELVQKIKRGSKLFLYDFDSKLLYGVYKATSKGELGLEPTAFSGRFPAQVEFEIFKECLPLPEKVFKESIKDNYQGSKFRQDLSGKQVKKLVALFRPITAPASATAAPTLANVVAPYTRPCRVREEGFQLPAKVPPPYGSYVSGIHRSHVLPVPVSQQVITRIPHDQYKSEACAGHVQPPFEPWHMVQQVSHRHPIEPYLLPGAHEPYVPENPSLSVQDPYGRYGQTLEVVPRDQVPGYRNEYHALQSTNNREIVQHSQKLANYYSQHLPPAPVPASSRSHLQTNAQRELLSSYQTHYPVTSNEDLHWPYADPHQRPFCASSSFQTHESGNTSLAEPSLQRPLTGHTSLIDASLQRPFSGNSSLVNSSFRMIVSRHTSMVQDNLRRL